jgi:hypothetical protein
MEKEQTLAFIQGQLATGKISKEDLMHLAGVNTTASQAAVVPASTPAEPVKEENSKRLIHTFYAIGAIIAIIGVTILVVDNWTGLGFAGRILVTLGLSLAAYVLGLMIRNPEQKILSQVMFVISAVLAPIGVLVLLDEAGLDFSLESQIASSVILTIIYGVALLISKRNILVIITVGFATWAYYALLLKVFSFGKFDGDLLQWATMLLGVAYLCLGYGYRMLWPSEDRQDNKDSRAVQNILYGLATVAILGGGIFVGGFFDLILIGLIFGAFYGSVYLRSRAMLTFGALFLMAHIIKLTSEYFIDSIGWPVALIAIGFLIIGIGYGTFYLNKKFITEHKA